MPTPVITEDSGKLAEGCFHMLSYHLKPCLSDNRKRLVIPAIAEIMCIVLPILVLEKQFAVLDTLNVKFLQKNQKIL
jgi:hypothetical protein